MRGCWIPQQVHRGIRVKAPALTTPGLLEGDFIKVAYFIHKGVQIAIKVKGYVKSTKLKDFIEFIKSSNFQLQNSIVDLKKQVESFPSQFPLFGVGTENLS